jgi:DNA gyrase subunit A
VLLVTVSDGADRVLCVASDGRALGVAVEELALLSGPGKGSTVMRVAEGERLVGAGLALAANDTIAVETEKGKTVEITAKSIAGQRGASGEQVLKRDRFTRTVPPPVVVPTLEVS